MSGTTLQTGPIPDAALRWQHEAARLTIDGRAVIGGVRVESHGTFTRVNPATGADLAEIASLDVADVDEAVVQSRDAFDDGRWSDQSAESRKRVMLRLADLIEANADELALLESLDMGKPVTEARNVDVPGTAETFRWYAEAIDKITDEVPATPQGSTAIVSREALGVVAAIVPWNYPLEIASWKLAPALALGNSLILKPAMQSSLSALRLADLAAEAGLPDGVLSVVTGRGSVVGKALGLHPDVDALAFTGSTAVAKQLLHYSGDSNMKRLSLEAGGKSAGIVFADTDDLALAAERAAFGAFYNQGEVCSANSRLLLDRAIYDQFIELLVEAARSYHPGDPLLPTSAAGALVSEEHADSVWAAVNDGRRDGSLLHGGERLEINGSTAFITPTIVESLGNDHRLQRYEVFGPLLTVTPFDSEEEAIRLANATSYGLAASVWTGSLARAHRVASRLVAGTVSVNTVDALGLTTPFGGFKQSGFGRDLSLHALDNYSAVKTTWIQFG